MTHVAPFVVSVDGNGSSSAGPRRSDERHDFVREFAQRRVRAFLVLCEVMKIEISVMPASLSSCALSRQSCGVPAMQHFIATSSGMSSRCLAVRSRCS